MPVKRRGLEYKEAKLFCVQIPGSTTVSYGVTLGNAALAGKHWKHLVAQVTSAETPVHAVVDGAPWILRQFGEQFQKGRLLVDFYHVSEYLGRVREKLNLSKAWFHQQQTDLLEGRLPAVLRRLQKLLARDVESVVGTAQRYLRQRRKHLFYQEIKDTELPIGSGVIEAGHRSVLQARLKQSGMWWKFCNLEKMAHLCVMRANQQWEAYWEGEFLTATR